MEVFISGVAMGAVALTLISFLNPKPTPPSPLPQVVQKVASVSPSVKTVAATPSAKPVTPQSPSGSNGIPILMYH